jgi:adenosylcobinamide-GDP ribazoletransferase
MLEMREIIGRFFSTFSIVSRIPVRHTFAFDLSRFDFYFPVVGIFPAALVALVLRGAMFCTGSPLVAVVLALAAQYLAFNLFHFDGLVDTADAFLGAFDREKRRAILKDSRIGVYGLFAGIAVLALKAALLYALFPYLFLYPAALFAYPISARFSSALVPTISPPASPEGLGALVKNSRISYCIAGLIAGLILWNLAVWAAAAAAAAFGGNIRASFAFPAVTLFALPLAAPLVSVFFAQLYRRHLGGYTGDTMGAAVEIGEALHLLLALVVLTLAR